MLRLSASHADMPKQSKLVGVARPSKALQQMGYRAPECSLEQEVLSSSEKTCRIAGFEVAATHSIDPSESYHSEPCCNIEMLLLNKF